MNNNLKSKVLDVSLYHEQQFPVRHGVLNTTLCDKFGQFPPQMKLTATI
jgi:hypothetical protein